MGKIRSLADGDVCPKAGTQVIFRKGRYGTATDNALYGKTVYVTAHPGTDRCIVVDTDPGSYHGTYCAEWEEVNPVNNVLDSLSDEEKQALARAALDAAERRGYCEETKNILSDLGLPTGRKRTVTVEIEVEENDGYHFSVQNLNYDSTSGNVKVLNKQEV